MDKGLAEIDIRIVSESDFTELMKEHEHKFYEEVSGLNIPILISEPEREKLIKMKMSHAVSPMENPLQIKFTRKAIARVMTELSNRRNTSK